MSANITWDCTDPGVRDRAITQAASIMRNGGLVIMPTENCYVVATDAFSVRGTSLLRRAKVQPGNAPLGLLVAAPQTVSGVAARVPERAHELMTAFWPGMLTLLLPAQPTLAWDHPAGAPVAVRMPLHPFALAVCAAVGPVAASAASMAGAPAPVTAQEAIDSLADDVDAVCDVGPLGEQSWSDVEDRHLASTVVDLANYPASIVRSGAIPDARVESVLRPRPGATVEPSGPTTTDPE